MIADSQAFSGNETVATGSAGRISLAGGMKGSAVRNGKGIIIDLTATQEVVSFNLGGEGFTISME